MEIRILGDEQMQEAYYLSAQAFRGGIRDDHFALNRRNDTNRTPSTTFGIYDAAGLQAKIVVIHYREQFGDSYVAPMGGIAGVACLPASRGKGYAAAGVNHALQFMRDNGMYLSALYPFAWAFYRKLGWEWVGMQKVYTAPTSILHTTTETENVRLATSADRAAIASTYNRYSVRYRGLVLRDDRIWNQILNDGDKTYTYTYIYEGADGPEGYFTFNEPQRETTSLNEFVALSSRARCAMLGLLKRHEMQVKAFKWTAPEDDTLWSNVMHWDLSTRLEPVVQARIVDIAAAFRALKPSTDISGVVTIAVKDDVATWNNGVWKVVVEAGSVEISRCSCDPDVSCDIQAITQAYYGSPSLDVLRTAETLQVHHPHAYGTLAALLKGPPMWLNDHF